MWRRVTLWTALSLCGMALSWGCIGVGQPSQQCDAGKQHFTPGCGDNNSFTAGCYATCDAKNPCPSGEECKNVSVQPECAKPTTPGGAVCGACGQGAALCFPKASGNQCPAGQEHHTPGCGGEGQFTAGCYVPCQDDSACASGETCKEVMVTPSCAKNTKPGQGSCAACASGKKLCMAP